MREKGKYKKEKKILIRVNKDEKKLSETLSSKEGLNTSEFFRKLLRDHSLGLRLEKIIRRLERAASRSRSRG